MDAQLVRVEGECSSSIAREVAPVDIAGPSSSTAELQREENGFEDENEPLIEMGECRICQEDDSVNELETPCGCSGSLKYAHRKCVQLWCNEKGDITCEICHQPYEPGYTAPPRPPPEETTIEIGDLTIAGTPVDLRDPRFMSMAEAEHHLLECEYDDYAASSARGAAFCRSAALILMVLLLLRHMVSVSDAEEDDDAAAFLTLFLLRAVSFLLPCYIMAWVIGMLQRRKQRQEAAAALAAAQLALVLRSGQRRALHVAIASGPPVSSSQESV